MKREKEKPIYQPNRQRDISKQTFNKLTAVNFEYRDDKMRHYWRFRCECGRELIIRKGSVTSGNTKMCKECANIQLSKNKTTHGMSKTRIYKEWAGMIQRCTNPKNTSYERYGAKGVTVCDEWLDDFMNFYNWAMANGYRDDLTIDRIDNEKGYSPDNCRWATEKEQAYNKKSNRNLTYKGKTMTMAEWAKVIGISSSSLFGRMKRGWSVEKALSTPPIKEKRNNNAKNK